MAFGSKNSTPSFVLTLPLDISLNEQDYLYIDTETLKYDIEALKAAFPAFLKMHENTKKRLQEAESYLPASVGF